MTTIDTKHLRALAEAATPGPWEAETWTHQFDDEITFGYVEANECSIWDHSGGNTVANAADADYIAAIDPPTLIALLGEIERLRGDTEWEYYATARKGYVAGEPRVHERGATQAYEEALDQVVFEQEDETPVVFKRRVGPWEPVEEKTDD